LTNKIGGKYSSLKEIELEGQQYLVDAKLKENHKVFADAKLKENHKVFADAKLKENDKVFAEVDATIRIGFPCLYTGMGSATSFVGK
jgi:glutaredoxin-related protein